MPTFIDILYILFASVVFLSFLLYSNGQDDDGLSWDHLKSTMTGYMFLAFVLLLTLLVSLTEMCNFLSQLAERKL